MIFFKMADLQVLHRFMLPPAMELLDALLEQIILHSSHVVVLGKAVFDVALAHFFSCSCALLPLVQTPPIFTISDGLPDQ